MNTALNTHLSFSEQIKAEGFVLIPSLFKEHEIQLISEVMDRVKARALSLQETTMVEGSQFVVENEFGKPRIHRVVWCGACEPLLLAAGRDRKILSVVEQILQSTRVDHLINQIHFKEPGDGVEFAWHQDAIHRRYGTELWNNNGPNGSFVQTLLAIDKMNLENGTIELIPFSHKRGFIEVDENRCLPESEIDEEKAIALILEPGDFIAFHPFLIHGSRPNHSDSSRRVLINGFSYPGANKRIYPGAGAGESISTGRQKR